MIDLISADLSLFTIIVLLILSIITIYYLKHDEFVVNNYTEYLFHGHKFLFNLSSNLGAIFSVTYFFGATVIYSAIYGYWLLVIGGFSFAISYLFYNKIITEAEKFENRINMKGNIFLSILMKRLTQTEFRKIIFILLLIYFGLLIEELAVTRLIISTIFPISPFLTTSILFIIVFIIFIYLYFGGFRAVINSDFVQSFVLIFFLIMLVYFIAFDSNPNQFETLTTTDIGVNKIFALLTWGLFFIAWQTSLIDFYSRLNINGKAKLLTNTRKNLTLISFILLFTIMSIGILFGTKIATLVYAVDNPIDYTNAVIKFFLSSNSMVVKAIFLISLFSMIFTTIDTLLITLLQIGSFQKTIPINRKHLSLIILIASFISMILDLNSVCAFGIYVGSLMILIFIVSLQKFVLHKINILPHKLTYNYFVLALSLVLFLIFYKEYESNFSKQFYIPLIVLISTLVFIAVFKIYYRLSRHRI